MAITGATLEPVRTILQSCEPRIDMLGLDRDHAAIVTG
jgi:hypothetical protein